jgi:hypothetical protein
MVDGRKGLPRSGSSSSGFSFRRKSWKGFGDPRGDPSDSQRRTLEDWAGLKSLSFEKIGVGLNLYPPNERISFDARSDKTLLRDLVMVKTLKSAKLIHSDLLHVMEPMATS